MQVVPPGELPERATALPRRQVLTGIAAAALLGPVSALLGPGRSAADPARGRRVAVFGGGPGGMAAAHELAERGFQVSLYDKNERLGGMVRAYTNPLGTSPNPFEMSAQHFILPTYAILPDTLKRIPDGRGGSVFDRAAFIPNNPNIPAGNQGQRVPLTIGQSRMTLPLPLTPTAIQTTPIEKYPEYFVDAISQLGKYTPADAMLLASKVAAWITSGPNRCNGQLDSMTLREFFRTDQMSPNAAWIPWIIEHSLGSDAKDQGGSANALKDFFVDPAFRTAEGRPGYYWGVNPEATSMLPAGICFDGPETEVWFDPWARYLESHGASFNLQHTVTRLNIDKGRITSASVQDPTGRTIDVEADYFVVAIPGDKMQNLFTPDLLAADNGLHDAWNVVPAYETGFQLFFRELDVTLGMVSPENGWYLFLGGVNAIWQRDLRQYGSGEAGAALDIEIFSTSLFSVPGSLYGKPMLQLTREETIAEIREHLIRYADMADAFRPGNFVGWTPHTTLRWSSSGWEVTDTRAGDALGNAGRRPRPAPISAIPNLFLAGGSVRNSTSVDSQEAAMETARTAVNGILDQSGVGGDRCWLPDYSPPRLLEGIRAEDDRRYAAGLPNIFDMIAPAPMPATR